MKFQNAKMPVVLCEDSQKEYLQKVWLKRIITMGGVVF